MSARRAWLLVALGALGLAASYPPFPLPVLSFVAIAPAVLLIRRAVGARAPGWAFRWGFRYGLAAQGLLLYWMIVALWHFTPLSALGYLATVLILGLFTGTVFWFVTRVRLRLPAAPLWVVLPLAWTTFEWAVGHLGDASFPWLGLGTSLADAPILVQWADLAGARGATLWVAWANVMIVEAFVGKGDGGRGQGTAVVGALAPVVVSLVLVLGYGIWRVRTLPLREVGVVGMIQPNEGFREKWDPAHRDSVVAKLMGMSRQALALARPGLIIWPEAAIPEFLWWHPDWETGIATLARETHTPILAGTLHAAPGWRQGDPYYNAALFIDSTGDWRSSPAYGKRYLVPVVERVPFVPVRVFRAVPGLARWSGGFSAGRELPVYAAGFGKFGVVICFESAFEDLARRYRRAGADFLVNITNDAWFGRTSAPHQHASHLVLRAIETRMGIARAANSGISEFVDPRGWAYAASRLDTQAVVADRLRTSDVIPLYVRWGDWVGNLVVIATLGLAGALLVQRWRGGL